MIQKDLHNTLAFERGLSPVVVSDNTAQATQIVDLQNSMGVEFVIATGTLADADATFAVTMTHGDASDLSDGVAVPATEILGTLAAAGFTFANDDAIRSVGYAGTKRYVRLTITPTNNAGSAPLAVVVVKRPRTAGFTG